MLCLFFNTINWIDFGTLVRECAGTAVGLHPQYRVCIAEVTPMLMGDTSTDWRTHVRHVVDVIGQHIDKVIVPQWVQVAVEHLDDDKLTVPAELAATFPLILMNLRTWMALTVWWALTNKSCID